MFEVDDDVVCWQRNSCESRVNKPPTDGACGPYYLTPQFFIDAEMPAGTPGSPPKSKAMPPPPHPPNFLEFSIIYLCWDFVCLQS